MTDVNTAAIIDAGMYWPREKLGVLEAESFIAAIRNEYFDYTEWRRDNLFRGMTLEEINEAAAKFSSENPRPRLRGEAS
jgi:hypothetical protein